jgi:hypothetical protein
MSDEKRSGLIWSAVITVIGGIIVAWIGLHRPSDSNAASRTTIDRSTFHGQTNIDSTVINNGFTESKFDRDNGVKITGFFGSYTAGTKVPEWNPRPPQKGKFGLFVINESNRNIKALQLLVFPEGVPMTGRPMGVLQADDFPPKFHLRTDIPLAGMAPPPKTILLCLTYESETPGQFLTFLLSAVVDIPAAESDTNNYYHSSQFQYQIRKTEAAFKSSIPGNCTQQGETAKIDISDSRIFH